MTDCFALLDEPRRPWLDPEELKQKFHAVSAQCHPDRFHNAPEGDQKAAQQRYSELNGAYQRLREPKDRLQHLLELELGAKPSQVQSIPPGLMDISMHVAQICREADALAQEKHRTTSPLLQIPLFERAQEVTGKLTALRKQMNERHDELLNGLKRLDDAWTHPGEGKLAREQLLKQLEETARLLSYFTRWLGQIQERIVQLSF